MNVTDRRLLRICVNGTIAFKATPIDDKGICPGFSAYSAYSASVEFIAIYVPDALLLAVRRERINEAIDPVSIPEPTVQISTHQTSWVITPPRKNFTAAGATDNLPGNVS